MKVNKHENWQGYNQSNLRFQNYIRDVQSLTLFHMGGGGGWGDSCLLQIVFFITFVRDAAEPRNSVTSKI